MPLDSRSDPRRASRTCVPATTTAETGLAGSTGAPASCSDDVTLDLPVTTPERQACQDALCSWFRFVTIRRVLEVTCPVDPGAPRTAHAGGAVRSRWGADPTTQRRRAASTDRWLATESIDRLEAAERIEPTEANDPMEPIESALPIDPIESTDPVDPMLSTDPVERIDRIEPRESRDQRDEPLVAPAPAPLVRLM